MPSAFILVSKMTLLGIIDFFSIVDMSIGKSEKTFCDIREFISFSKAEVHFSGVGEFEIDAIDFGI